MRLVRRPWVAALVLALAAATAALAQREFFGGYGYGRVPAIHNIPYDGQFTFVRIKYETAPGGYWAGGRPSWVHGYPIAEEHLMRIAALEAFGQLADRARLVASQLEIGDKVEAVVQRGHGNENP